MAVETEDMSIRETIEASMEQVAEKEASDAPDTTDDATPPPEDKATPPDEKPADEKPADEKPAADKKDAKPDAKKDAKSDTTEPLPDTKLPRSRAPGSWKPLAREKWASLDASVQQEILRRERDIANGFNEVANARKFTQEFQTLANGHAHIIAAEGGDVMKVTRDLFQTAAALYSGSPQQKVATVAAMIKNFGIDLQMLDGFLAGQPNAMGNQQDQPQNLDAMVNARVQAALQPFLQQSNAGLEQSVTSELETFATDPKNEFFEDVKMDMADVLEMAAKRNQKMTLQDAYSRAIMLNSEIADLVTERKLREKTDQRNDAAVKARRKAVSVRSTPSRELASGDADGAAKASTMRDDIQAAIEANAE